MSEPPRRCFGLAVGAGLGAGDSRPGMAVESLDTRPARWPFSVLSSNASCRCPGRSLAANSAKAREKVASLGTPPAASQPHRRRRVGSVLSRSTSARVVGTSSTAFARKARASAARYLQRPAPPAPAVGQPLLHPDEPLVALAEGTQSLLQPGEQLPLKREPVS